MENETDYFARAVAIASGDYQYGILHGWQSIAGSDLRGAARKWSSKYQASRKALVSRLLADGIPCYVARGHRGKLTFEIGEPPEDSHVVGTYLGAPLVVVAGS